MTDFTKEWVPPLLSYCLSSILMTVTNKLIMSGSDNVFFVLMIQTSATVIMLLLSKHVNIISFDSFSLNRAKKWLPVALSMAVMLYTGAKSLEYLSISVFTIFKNMTIVLIALSERFLLDTQITPLMWISFLLMITSSLVAAGTDVNFNKLGYFWVTLNCCSCTFYVLYMRSVIKKLQFRDLDTVFYNNLLTAPLFLLLSLNKSITFEFMTLFSGLSAFLISYSSAWCMRVVNSTTYSMAGALNKLPISVAGLVFLGEHCSLGGIISIILGFIAGCLYTKSKIKIDEAVIIKL